MLAVFRHALIFGLGPVLQKAASLVLLPLYTHHLSPADYGEIELLTLLVGLFVVLFGLEYRQGYIRALNRQDAEGAESRVISASIAFFLFMAVVGSLCFLVVLPFFCDAMLGHRLGAEFGTVLLLGLFADIMNFLLMATAQARLWSARMVSLSLTQFIFGTSLSVYLIVGLGAGPVGLFAGNTVGSLFMTGALLFLVRRDLSLPRRVRETVQPIVGFSFPLLVGALIYFLLRQVDRVVISEYLTLEALGLYSMGWKLSSLVMTFMFLPFVRSFDVWRFRFYDEGGRADDVARIFRIFLAGVAAAALALATYGADLFILVADRRFEGAMALLPVLNAATLLQCCYTVTASAFYVSGATKVWLRILALGAVIQIVGSIALVQLVGVYGAAGSMVCANLIVYLVAARKAPAYWDVPYPHALVLVLIGAATLLSYARTFWPRDDIVLSMWLNAGLFLTFVAVVFAVGAVRGAEVREIGQLGRDKARMVATKLHSTLRSMR